MLDFTHLHLHTEYSMLDGYGKVEEYIKRAKRLKYKFLGITDHGNIDGLIHFQRKCLENDITPILGCEAYLTESIDSKKETGHITFWIKNRRGFKNLCSMLSIANLDNFYRKPLITFDNLREHYSGLVIGTACLGSFINLEKGEDFFLELKELLPKDDLFLEIMLSNMPEQEAYNKKVLSLSKLSGAKIIFTHDCHYAEKKDSKYQEMMLAIQRKAKWNDPNRWKFPVDNLYLLSKAEVKKLIKEHDSDISYADNTRLIVEKCKNFRIKKGSIDLPKIESIPDEAKELNKLCMKKIHELFGQDKEKKRIYLERYQYEFKTIKKLNFERYIMIVYELCKWSKDNNILVGPCRGSAGGSLICYLLGITEVDPIKYNLFFERFITEDRIDYPDIDLDFDRDKIMLIKRHLESLYGADKVATVSNFNSFKAKGSIQDVARVFGVYPQEVNAFTKTINIFEHESEEDTLDASIKTEEGKEFNRKYPKIIEYAKAITGRKRNYGQHAGAIVIAKNPIDTSGKCNLIRGKDIRVNWDKNDVEYVGFIKFDILKLRFLTIISEALSQIEANHNKKIDLNKLDLEDYEVLDEIDSNRNEGVFQLDTKVMSQLISEMEISSFDNLVHLLALCRPGPKESGMVEQYIERQRSGDWERLHEVYEDLTSDTFGLLLFQEQIMLVINKVAGLHYSIADKIRKIIAKKKEKTGFEEYEKLFFDGCKKTSIFNRSEAERFWELLQHWAGYGFSKSHSVGYSIISYWCAYLKYYYPSEFISASLTCGVKAKKQNLIDEAVRLGASLYLPKVGISDPIKWIAKDNKLYVPFSEISGLGEKKAVEAATMPHLQKTKGRLKFFTMDDIVSKHKGSLGDILSKIKAYDKEDNNLNYEALSLFDFDLR